MSSLDDVYIEKRLSSVANTQESIQSLSLWALHHKAQHKQIVNIWLQLLKSATLNLRLNLFYLCNEMVQTCKKRNADLFKDSFKGVLAEAVVCVRDSPVRSNIERIFRIWIERNVYEADYVDELMTILHNDETKSPVEAKLLAEFKPEKLLDLIRNVRRISHESEMKRKKSHEFLSFNVHETDGYQLRPRSDGSSEEEYSESLARMSRCLNECVFSLDSELTQRRLMLQQLELSEIYYDDQYSDALVVAQAYKNFGNRINNLKVKLVEYQKLLPDPRPQSPLTTINARVNTDDGVLSALQPIKAMKTSDVLTSSRNDYTSTNGLETILPKLDGGFMTFLPKRIPSLGSQYVTGVAADALSASSVAAAGDSTPVQDEEPDEPLPFDNPMQFLSQLINRSAAAAAPAAAAASRPPLSTALSVSTDEHQIDMKTIGLGITSSQPEPSSSSSSLLDISHQMMSVNTNVEGLLVSSLSTELLHVDTEADVHSVGPDESVLHMTTANLLAPADAVHSLINNNLELTHHSHLPTYGHSLCTDYNTFSSLSWDISAALPHSRTSEFYLGNSYNNDITDIAPSPQNYPHFLEDESINDSVMPLSVDVGRAASHDHAVNQRHMSRPSHPHPYRMSSSSSSRLPLQRPFHLSEFNSTNKTSPRQQPQPPQLFNKPEAQRERFYLQRPSPEQRHVGQLESTNYGNATLLHCQNPSSVAFRFRSVSPITFPPCRGHRHRLDSTDSAFQPHLSVNHT